MMQFHETSIFVISKGFIPEKSVLGMEERIPHG